MLVAGTFGAGHFSFNFRLVGDVLNAMKDLAKSSMTVVVETGDPRQVTANPQHAAPRSC
ncbi:MAG TPA: hypothetical protein VJS86_12375 [Arthrobacter sp.]|nr:hypothetical protein [Arthrobacter sp.]